MKILVTGSKGFVGKNLIETLKNIRDKKDLKRPDLIIDRIFEFDVDTEKQKLKEYGTCVDFVFHLAGVNRPKEDPEFMTGNFCLTSELLEILENTGRKVPVMLASSIQASGEGRYKNSEYGKSKQAAEEIVMQYSERTEAKVFVYRFPNLFGKWCKPDYNSVVATFCNAIANDLPYQVNDEETELELLYIDDLVEGLIDLLSGKEKRCDYAGINIVENVKGRFCYIPETYRITLGKIVSDLQNFANLSKTFRIPVMADHTFEKKLYSTYLSYLPKEKTTVALQQNIDNRGSFTEILKTVNAGQLSVNVSRPGITKGQHWHNSKWEIFVVISGHALIQQRKVGTDGQGNRFDVMELEVSGEHPKMVYILPGYIHKLVNLSMTEDLVTLIWANENFDKEKPDTYYEEV